MARKIAEVRRNARAAKAFVRRGNAHNATPVIVDHRKSALFGSASAVAVAAMLTAAVMLAPTPVRAEPSSGPASCTETVPNSGNWFCDNSPVPTDGDIDGNADANTITIVGGNYSWYDGAIGFSNVNGLGGDDVITVAPDATQTDHSSIYIKGSINGGEGDDTISFGGGSLSSGTGTVSLFQGNIDGGDGDDVINVTASDQVATSIERGGIPGTANIYGGSGNDDINIFN